MLSIKPINLNKAVELDKLVTNYKPVDNDSVSFTQDGVFSPAIFGNLGNTISWSCNCGNLQGEFNEGVTCSIPECNSPVTNKGLSIQKCGWIDLKYTAIHPLFFRYFRKIIGITAFNKILKYKSEIHVDGHILQPELAPPYIGIGVSAFIENYREILDYFYAKKMKSADVSKEYNFILSNIDAVFTNYYPIINSRLRPAIVIDGDFSFDEINILYNTLIRNSSLLEGLTSIEQHDINIQGILLKSQFLLNEIYTSIVNMLSSKEGIIRNSLLGNRLNFTSRMVITPLDSSYTMDDCLLPYKSAVELFKPQIIKKLSILKGISSVKAEAIWLQAALKFSPVVYKIMIDLIKKPNVNLIINRNPTSAIGSILFLRIAGIKKDLDDLTTSIHNLILASMGADYDGDVLNFILVMSKHFTELFETFRPHNILVDADSGAFNSTFLPAKDTLLGLSSLFPQ